jgi:putative ABC transport system ATP-binding protein
MDRSLFRYIWRFSKPEQVHILFLVICAQVFYFLSLSIPKTIVNDGIEGKAFRTAPEVTFLRINIPLPSWLGDGSLRIFDGVALSQLPYLIALSCLFLMMVIVNGLFKKTINTQKGRMGERMLRRLRYALYDRILLFPNAHFRKVKQAELATMIKDEVEPLGGFIGDAFVQPMFLGGQALTALLFIMLQHWALGLVVIAMLAVQAFIIPRLRRHILVLGKQRQITARALAGRIAETADGVHEIHVHGTSNYERADIADRLGTIFGIRFELFQRKFTAKFLNNLLAQVTPFLIYLVGGWFAISGQMDVGAVVGVLLAYKDLPSPIKELIDWDQQRQDVQIKYEQVIDQFQPEGMLDPNLQALPAERPARLAGELSLAGLSVSEDGHSRQLDSVSLAMPLAGKLAVIGAAGSGKEMLGHVIARMALPSGGSISIGGQDLERLPEAVVGARMSHVGQDVYLFPVSVRDNLLYGLKQRPVVPAQYPEATARLRATLLSETRRAGNADFDPRADWVDIALADVSDQQAMTAHIIAVLKAVEFEEDIYQLGLRGTFVAAERPDAAAAILRAREELYSRLQDPALTGLVEPFDRDRYSANMSVAENLLFGTATDRSFDVAHLGTNPQMQALLEREGLTDVFISMGLQIAETMVELFADLPPGHPFFDQYSFISSEDLPQFRLLLQRLGGKGVEAVPVADRARLAALPLHYIEPRHRLGLIDPDMQQRLLAARHAFAESLPADLASKIEFYDRSRYNSAATLQDNILFGRLVFGQAQAERRVGALISEVLEKLELRGAVDEVGLDYNVGVAGRRLSPTQRQKLGLARALVKRPDLLVVSDAIAVLDGAAQQRLLDNILRASAERGVIWVLGRASLAARFDQVVVMQGGRIAEQGTPKDLAARGGIYAELIAAG